MKNIIKKFTGFVFCLLNILTYLKYGLYYSKCQNNLSYKILLVVHAIEKGLGIKNTRLGFGTKKINDLLSFLKEWERNGFSLKDYSYIYAINVLKIYICYHDKQEFNTPFIEQLRLFVNNRTVTEIESGFKTYNNDFDRKDLISLITNRHSIRDYNEREVTREEILKCIKLALTAPSACNRQPSKCYFSMDKLKIEKIGELVPGNTGFNKVNNYLVITADISAFGIQEYSQWMTNAGIFITYLSLILEYNNINNCILQWADVNNSDKSMRSLLGIPKNEQIVAAISVGYANPNCKILQSKRKSVEEICIEV